MARQAIDVIELHPGDGGTYTFSVAAREYRLLRAADLWILEMPDGPPDEELAFLTLGDAVEFALDENV